jgi:plasmid replication initiation protein
MGKLSNIIDVADLPADWEVKKHVALIHSSGELTKVERVLVNVLLFNAYDDLLTKKTHTIPSKFLTPLIGWSGNGLNDLKKSLERLAGRVIKFNLLEDKKPVWEINHFISKARIADGVCTYEYHEDMAKLMYEPEIYAMIRASLEYKLPSSYAINLYENCIRFVNTKHKTTGWWDLERFRLLMGANIPSYDDFKYLKRDIVVKPIKDINTHTDINLTFELRKVGRTVTDIKFNIEEKADKKARMFDDDALDDYSEIKNGDTYKNLIKAGLGAKLALMYVLKDEARAKAILNTTEDDRSTGKIKKPGAYIKKVYESDSVILDFKELDKNHDISSSELDEAQRLKEAKEQEKKASEETRKIAALIQSLPQEKQKIIIDAVYLDNIAMHPKLIGKLQENKIAISEYRAIAVLCKKKNINLI